MAAPPVDTRKLKDAVADALRKGKFEKAAETLELLVQAEPKDMTHRLRLGDTYRRLEQIDKAVASYQIVAKHYGDEGQLIKAIGAVKIILEVDPRNEMAQRQLSEMNSRRRGKATLESIGLKRPAAVAEATTKTDLELPSRPAATAEAQLAGSNVVLSPIEDDEPLELDLPASAGKRSPPPPDRKGPAKTLRGSFELGGSDDFMAGLGGPSLIPDDNGAASSPSRSGSATHLSGEDLEELEELPDDAIVPLDATGKVPPAAAAWSARQAQAEGARATPAKKPKQEVVLDLEDEPLPGLKGSGSARTASSRLSGPPRPIADLLDSDAEEEVELLSITSDEKASGSAPEDPKAGSVTEALDQAIGAIARSTPRKLPPRVPLFDDLPKGAFVELVNRLSYRRFSPPELILREGDPGRSFFVIVEGRVRVFKEQPGGPELTLAHLGEGAFFGEMALLSGAPRAANVAAEEDTEVLEVSDQVLREVAEKFPQVGTSLKNFYRQRLLNNVMAISPLFRDFDPAERKSIVERFKMKQVEQGVVLIHQGKPSDGLYVLLHGAVTVSATSPEGTRVTLARLKEGDLFGEMSLLTRNPASATVKAASKAILLKLPRAKFQELVVTHPQILALVSELSEQRKSSTEAILQGQGPGIDGMAFV